MHNLYLNGEFMPLEQGRVSVEDRGFNFGDGIYEVIRVYDGQPFQIGDHMARLERSLAGVEIPLPEPIARIEEICRRVIGTLREASIYIQVTRGTAPRKHGFPADVRPTFLAWAREVTPPPPDKTFSLLSMIDDRWGRCHLKTLGLLPNVLGKQRALEAGCDEGLFVREDGAVTEGTSSNAFLVRAGTIVTHPANNRILHGCTREVVIRLARQAGVPVREQPFTLAEARAADEFFMTGTLTEVMPVVSLDGNRIGSGVAGPTTLKLRDAFRELVRQGSQQPQDASP